MRALGIVLAAFALAACEPGDQQPAGSVSVDLPIVEADPASAAAETPVSAGASAAQATVEVKR